MRRYFFDWLFYVTMWVVITLFYSVVFISITTGVIDFLGASEEWYNDPVNKYMTSITQYVEAIIFGILFGTASFGIHQIIDRTSIHRLSFWKIIVTRTVLYFIAIFFIFWMMFGIITTSGMTPIDAEEFWEFWNESDVPFYTIFGVILFFGMSTLLINFVAMVSRKFGPTQMLQILMGRYNKPITENRMFMFLDLKDSTAIAERLGHIIYSKLLQQCFLDLNKLLPNAGAEIYQYVGDEAVLTWRVRDFDQNFTKPVKLFFVFKKKLEMRKKYYTSKFGVLPKFKAGLHAGVVTVAEIGDIKREIAYHGDVVNTTSRLRSACNEFQKDLLASEYVVGNIDQTSYTIEEIGEVTLRGKKNSIKVFSIE